MPQGEANKVHDLSRRQLLVAVVGGVALSGSGCLGPAAPSRNTATTTPSSTPTTDSSSPDQTPTSTAEMTHDQSPSVDESPDKPHPNLETELDNLHTADDPAAYAEQIGVEFSADNEVKVLVEVTDANASVPPAATVDYREERLVVAWVHVEDLVTVAEAETVVFVQRLNEGTQE